MIEKRSRISGIILLLLFIFYYAGSNLFSHTHIIDGVKVVHSHPYSNNAHNHSRATIEVLSHTLFTFAAIVTAPLLISIFKGVINSFVKKYREEYNIIHTTPRAPPILNY